VREREREREGRETEREEVDRRKKRGREKRRKAIGFAPCGCFISSVLDKGREVFLEALEVCVAIRNGKEGAESAGAMRREG
jgi:hypothetical protein